MLSTQRLIMIFVLINILIGVGIGIYKNPTIYGDTTAQQEIDIMEDQQAEFEEEETEYGGIPTTDTSGEGKTIGNPIKMGAILWDIVLGGLNPLSIRPGMFQTTTEKIIATMLLMFRSLMAIIAGLELFLLFKNRKAT